MGSSNISVETGVPIGSEAKVICGFTTPAPGGYQVRRFTAIGGVDGWAMTALTATNTLTNVVSTKYKV